MIDLEIRNLHAMSVVVKAIKPPSARILEVGHRAGADSVTYVGAHLMTIHTVTRETASGLSLAILSYHIVKKIFFFM